MNDTKSEIKDLEELNREYDYILELLEYNEDNEFLKEIIEKIDEQIVETQ